METVARQLLVELSGCPASVLADKAVLGEALGSTARALGIHVIFTHVCSTGEDSVTGVAMADVAHVVMKAWPKEGMVTADIMATASLQTSPCIERLLAAFNASHHIALEIGRGALHEC
ncbi:S-adenosylmethionine decarboxylase [Candidatus Fermentibacteria bacterium]|nr:S-adenosylmethionine decarboxylase [Candidatus Fermentibacteria bacterium]